MPPRRAVPVLLLLGLSAPAPAAEADLTRKAKQVLETHCHRCHGKDGAVEGGFNYVLDLAKLADRKKVVPGNPDASPLLRRTSRTFLAGELMLSRSKCSRPLAAVLGHSWLVMGLLGSSVLGAAEKNNEKTPADLLPESVVAYLEVPRPADTVGLVLDHPLAQEGRPSPAQMLKLCGHG